MVLLEFFSIIFKVNVNSEYKIKLGSNRFLYVGSGILFDIGCFFVVGVFYGEEFF